ncbi:TraR/DksA family transcriptional regulator [Thermincola ferriacetica]|uniref:TraR/DksA family transcriptional regulator n=1 Tax=Thermincola ferriacetica TaxID=281456 RepID=A0A0L6W451_9FIRM|nr:TraR/DksA C4-type zinc finger protein [Thermincola ferriacetica]KNZ70153.1 TraR/DksA family transcriptional regulator [Thermincola ferriacetica]
MDRQSLQYFEQRLQQEKQDLLTRIDRMESTLDISLGDSLSELSAYDNHPADIGDELFERSKDIALREVTRIQLDQVEDALERIREGTYGRCERCGKEIPRERLEAMPTTTYCIECKEKDEELPDRHIRPIEEDVIAPPFGMRTHDDSQFELGDAEDEIEFDGEDAWQQVARWGTSETPQDISVHGITDYDHMYIDADENVGTVQDVESIPYEKHKDGMFYQDFDGQDDELFDDNVSLYRDDVRADNDKK